MFARSLARPFFMVGSFFFFFFWLRCRKRYNIVGRVVDLPDVVASK